jgi:penicillin amidase
MYRLGRILIIVLGILLVLVIAIGTLGVISVRRPFPTTDGQINLPGLDAKVEVFRDSFGVPHIYAKTSHDLFMAQGFIHSQDRFWQMEFFRRIGSGRLAELMGPGALAEDIFIRTVGWHRTARQEIQNLQPDERAILEAYAEGVNTYLELNRGREALEFSILRLTGLDYEPEPWTILNSITWAKFMAWDLGGNMDTELTRAHIAVQPFTPSRIQYSITIFCEPMMTSEATVGLFQGSVPSLVCPC